jgi:putative transposase
MHGNTKLVITLSKTDLNIVSSIIKKGYNNARVITRARVLFQFNKGLSSLDVAKYCGVSPETARRIGWKYRNDNLDSALYDKPRSGKKKRITEKDAATIIALACTDPPEGYERWTLRLIAEELVNRKMIESIGKDSVSIILKSHGLKPWREKNVVYTQNN